MRKTLFALAVMATLVAGIATSAAATPPIFEVRPFVGALIPTGDQRDALNDAVFFGGQGGIEIARSLHVIGTLAYAPKKNTDGIGVMQYDAGVETFRPYRMTERWEMRPFLGAGLGARTYVEGAQGGHTLSVFAGYFALGSEFQLDRIALRLEGRDYLTDKGLTAEAVPRLASKTRNDVSIVYAMAFHW